MVGIKKLSEVVKICEWVSEMLTQVAVTVYVKGEKVDVKVLAPMIEHQWDLFVQVIVSVMAEILAGNASRKASVHAMGVSASAYINLGAVETAVAGKMCGHSFMNGNLKEFQISRVLHGRFFCTRM